MPDKTGEEVQRGLTEGIRISTDAAKTVKSVQKAAAQASTGNYVAAGAELLSSAAAQALFTASAGLASSADALAAITGINETAHHPGKHN